MTNLFDTRKEALDALEHAVQHYLLMFEAFEGSVQQFKEWRDGAKNISFQDKQVYEDFTAVFEERFELLKKMKRLLSEKDNLDSVDLEDRLDILGPAYFKITEEMPELFDYLKDTEFGRQMAKNESLNH